jgi:dephospho-CoA kinase
MSRNKPIIGLSGAMGAGKSTVAQEFARRGAIVIDSDRISRELLGRPEVRERLVSWWGAGIVRPDGSLDRARIADIVFESDADRGRLEGLLYPLIAGVRQDMISRSIKDPAVRAIILDSPLLFESNLDSLCDAVVFVEASEAVRLERLRQARTWDQEQVARRARWQWLPQEKKRRSGYVILNEGSLEELRGQVTDVFEKIVARHSFT